MEKISPNPWCRNGHKDSGILCKYIHGGDRNKLNSTKRYPASQENGNVTVMTFSPFGTAKK